jgi:hypothetical protein
MPHRRGAVQQFPERSRGAMVGEAEHAARLGKLDHQRGGGDRELQGAGEVEVRDHVAEGAEHLLLDEAALARIERIGGHRQLLQLREPGLELAVAVAALRLGGDADGLGDLRVVDAEELEVAGFFGGEDHVGEHRQRRTPAVRLASRPLQQQVAGQRFHRLHAAFVQHGHRGERREVAIAREALGGSPHVFGKKRELTAQRGALGFAGSAVVVAVCLGMAFGKAAGIDGAGGGLRRQRGGDLLRGRGGGERQERADGEEAEKRKRSGANHGRAVLRT